MKTMIEVQYQEKNVKDGDLDKYVKETLKEQGVKTTEVETLNIYYLPETAKVFFVAIKKDGSELKGELDVNAMPEYPEVVKKTAAKKAPAKKAPAKSEVKKEQCDKKKECCKEKADKKSCCTATADKKQCCKEAAKKEAK